jgi:predicted permease
MGSLVQDLRYAVRTLLRAPGFTLVVVATLALGIGANTAIFSVLDAVVLRSLPYPQPDRLVTVWQDVTRQGGPQREWLSYSVYEDLRDEAGLFEAVGLWGGWGPTLSGVSEPAVLQGAVVSHEMFATVLGVQPQMGRGFVPSDDVEGAPGVVVLSHGAWQSRFNGDPAVLGRVLSLSEVPYTVVGIMPQGFDPPFVQGAEIWQPLGATGVHGCTRGCYGIRAMARLAPGVDLEQARGHLQALAARLESAYPDSHTNVGLAAFGLREDLARDASHPLWVLLGAVGLVLLIACTNVANLFLVRGAARRAELTVRVALGAGRGFIIRQVLTESLVLAAVGGGLGLILASWGTGALLSLAPVGAVPRLAEAGVDGRALLFTGALTLLTGLVFGLVPAWRAGRDSLQAGLRGGARGGRGGSGLRGALAVTQIALALVLLVGSGLLVRSFQNLTRADLGFEPEGVLAVSMALPGTRYDDGPSRQAYYENLNARLRLLPGVRAVGAVGALPLAGQDGDASFRVEGAPPPEPGENHAAWTRPITDGYLEAVGLELIAGRSFTLGDDSEAPRVVVINETLQRRYFPDQDPLGRRIAFGGGEDPTWRTIVGVAHDVRQFGIREPSRPAVYFPYRQVSFPNMAIVMKVDGDPSGLVSDVRATITQADPALAASSIEPLQTLVDAALAPDRFVTVLLTAFALTALLLAAVGIYGIVSFGVSRRMREMGIRKALGADGGDVLVMVLRGTSVLALLGVALGLAGSLAAGRLLRTLLYEVPANDPATFAATALLLGSVALLAGWVPAWRARRADPMAVLREE